MEISKFSVQVQCFNLIGFQRISKYPIFARVFQLFNAIIIICGMLPLIFFFMENFCDILAVADALGPNFTGAIALIKVISLCMWKEKFYELMDGIKKLSLNVTVFNAEAIKRANRIDKIIALVYLSCLVIVCSGYCLGPLLTNLIIFFIYGDDFKYNFKMPVNAKFPYDSTSFPAYELTYFMFCLGAYSTIFISVGVDSLFFGSCLNICAHFDILKDSFDGDKKKFVEYHQRILKLSEDLNELFKPIVFTQFFVSATLLCVLGFQLVMLDDVYKRVVVVFFSITVMIQLFVYAFGGQFILNKSTSVADNLYELDKDFVLIIARSQKGSVINAGIYRANLPAFLTVLKSAASFITLLESLIE